MLLYYYTQITQNLLLYIILYSKIAQTMQTYSISSSIMQSQKCLYCHEKDEMLKKYQKLVYLLKKKIKKCNTVTANTANSINKQQKQIILQQNKQQLEMNNDGCCQGKQEDKFSKENTPSLAITDFSEKYKIFDEKIKENKNKSQSTHKMLISTAPACFFRKQNTQSPKIINLSTQWLNKFTQLSKKILQKQQRINFLIDQIYRIKNQHLYIRSIFYNLLKYLTKMKYYQKIIKQIKGRDLLNLIVQIFQYSQDQIYQIRNNQNIYANVDKNNMKKVGKYQLDGNKDVYLPNFKEFKASKDFKDFKILKENQLKDLR